jgi:hypothetical protein
MIDFLSLEKYSETRMRIKEENTPLEWSEVPADGCECTSCRSRLDRANIPLPIQAYRYIADSETEQISNDHFFLLCDYVLHGWALNERTWGKLQ